MASRRKVPSRLRVMVALRAQGRCEYCRAPETFSLDSFTIDHIQPITQSGDDDLGNLAFACHNCNNRKQDDIAIADTETGLPTALFNPRRDPWNTHFIWSMDALTIIPLTATGRVPLARLQLNRAGVVNIRRALIALKLEHPPGSDNRQSTLT